MVSVMRPLKDPRTCGLGWLLSWQSVLPPLRKGKTSPASALCSMFSPPEKDLLPLIQMLLILLQIPPSPPATRVHVTCVCTSSNIYLTTAMCQPLCQVLGRLKMRTWQVEPMLRELMVPGEGLCVYVHMRVLNMHLVTLTHRFLGLCGPWACDVDRKVTKDTSREPTRASFGGTVLSEESHQ